MAWHPTATLAHLQQRARILTKIRAFFADRNILEVETPLLSQGTVTDTHIISLQTQINGLSKKNDALTYYLQTSPEFAMKRLLCAGSGDIYQICKAFRDGEAGLRHNPEFTMLEWYRLGFDHHDLMDEMDEFLQEIIGSTKAERLSYQAIFLKYLGIDPLSASLAQLKACAEKQSLGDLANFADACRDTWLNLLISHCIEPHLGHEKPIFIYDFPASQAALAKIRHDPAPVAERFEVFIDGMELANGFHELADAAEQRQRFSADLANRNSLGIKSVTIDEHFLSALTQGLPACAGVAVGIDRLVMLALNLKSLAEVIAFPVARA